MIKNIYVYLQLISLHQIYPKKQNKNEQMSTNILSKFRTLMANKNIHVYVLPRTDQHQSQYLSPCSERVAYLSGFTGSNGLALVSNSEALLWTDGRYFIQAQKQLNPTWSMKKMIQGGDKKWFQHILQKYDPKTTKIEIDGRLISAHAAKQRKKQFQQKGFAINFSDDNLVDQIWKQRPKTQMRQIYLHEEWAGRPMSEKVKWIREKIIDKKGEGAIFTDLGEIAWILNLRSSQIPYNPFFKSILVISNQGGYLYLPKMHPSFSKTEIVNHLKKQNIEIKEYDAKLPSKLLCQSNQLNFSIYNKISSPIQWDGIGLYRAVRNQKQLNGFRRCHLVDGVAQVKFWAWRFKQETINQYEAACKIDDLRSQQKYNKGLSFATISGGGPNGAIIHYHATKQNSSTVTKQMIHLVDSGGQYLDGTTDVTRAFHFGTPSSTEKQAYTRVLLGNLDIQRLKWPKKIKLTGKQIQILARRHLWEKGLDFSHGAGHGVGHFGSVHEGPVGISKVNNTVLQENMIVTNQPGYYEQGRFGIRIENMLIVKQIQPGLLGFQNLTLCPYDKNLIDTSLLNQKDISFINKYHKHVWDKLSTHIEQNSQTLGWLREATLPIIKK